MSDDDKRDDRKRKAESKEEEESDSDDGEMIGPLPTEAAPIKKPKVCALKFEYRWFRIVWSSDIRSFRLYGQFLHGPIC